MVAADHKVVDWLGGVEERAAPTHERTCGDDDVRLQSVGVVGDEMQLAGRRVVRRRRSERAPVACKVDAAQRVAGWSELVRG